MTKRLSALLAVGLLLGACARGADGPGGSSARPDGSSPVATTQPKGPPVGRNCHALLGDFVSALTELDSRVTTGVAFDDYGQQVGHVRVTYERIETSSVESKCLTTVALPAQRALNRYVEAYNIWNNCVGNNGCAEADVMPKLEAKWAEATSNIDAAETALAALPTK